VRFASSEETIARILDKTPFSAELLPVVHGFYCGDEEWEREVSDWIKGPALQELGPDCQVWLYSTADDGLVGYASLGGRR
jgi:hypothetical protein